MGGLQCCNNISKTTANHVRLGKDPWISLVVLHWGVSLYLSTNQWQLKRPILQSRRELCQCWWTGSKVPTAAGTVGISGNTLRAWSFVCAGSHKSRFSSRKVRGRIWCLPRMLFRCGAVRIPERVDWCALCELWAWWSALALARCEVFARNLFPAHFGGVESLAEHEREPADFV